MAPIAPSEMFRKAFQDFVSDIDGLRLGDAKAAQTDCKAREAKAAEGAGTLVRPVPLRKLFLAKCVNALPFITLRMIPGGARVCCGQPGTVYDKTGTIEPNNKGFFGCAVCSSGALPAKRFPSLIAIGRGAGPAVRVEVCVLLLVLHDTVSSILDTGKLMASTESAGGEGEGQFLARKDEAVQWFQREDFDPAEFIGLLNSEKELDQARNELVQLSDYCKQEVQKVVHAHHKDFLEASRNIQDVEVLVDELRNYVSGSVAVVANLVDLPAFPKQVPIQAPIAFNTQDSIPGAPSPGPHHPRTGNIGCLFAVSSNVGTTSSPLDGDLARSELPSGQEGPSTWESILSLQAGLLQELQVAVAEQEVSLARSLLDAGRDIIAVVDRDGAQLASQGSNGSIPGWRYAFEGALAAQKAILIEELQRQLLQTNSSTLERRQAAQQHLLKQHSAAGGDPDGVEYAGGLAQRTFLAIGAAAEDVRAVFPSPAYSAGALESSDRPAKAAAARGSGPPSSSQAEAVLPPVSALVVQWASDEARHCAALLCRHALTPFVATGMAVGALLCVGLALVFCVALESSHGLALRVAFMGELWPLLEAAECTARNAVFMMMDGDFGDHDDNHERMVLVLEWPYYKYRAYAMSAKPFTISRTFFPGGGGPTNVKPEQLPVLFPRPDVRSGAGAPAGLTCLHMLLPELKALAEGLAPLASRPAVAVLRQGVLASYDAVCEKVHASLSRLVSSNTGEGASKDATAQGSFLAAYVSRAVKALRTFAESDVQIALESLAYVCGAVAPLELLLPSLGPLSELLTKLPEPAPETAPAQPVPAGSATDKRDAQVGIQPGAGATAIRGAVPEHTGDESAIGADTITQRRRETSTVLPGARRQEAEGEAVSDAGLDGLGESRKPRRPQLQRRSNLRADSDDGVARPAPQFEHLSAGDAAERAAPRRRDRTTQDSTVEGTMIDRGEGGVALYPAPRPSSRSRPVDQGHYAGQGGSGALFDENLSERASSLEVPRQQREKRSVQVKRGAGDLNNAATKSASRLDGQQQVGDEQEAKQKESEEMPPATGSIARGSEATRRRRGQDRTVRFQKPSTEGQAAGVAGSSGNDDDDDDDDDEVPARKPQKVRAQEGAMDFVRQASRQNARAAVHLEEHEGSGGDKPLLVRTLRPQLAIWSQTTTQGADDGHDEVAGGRPPGQARATRRERALGGRQGSHTRGTADTDGKPLMRRRGARADVSSLPDEDEDEQELSQHRVMHHAPQDREPARGDTSNLLNAISAAREAAARRADGATASTHDNASITAAPGRVREGPSEGDVKVAVGAGGRRPNRFGVVLSDDDGEPVSAPKLRRPRPVNTGGPADAAAAASSGDVTEVGSTGSVQAKEAAATSFPAGASRHQDPRGRPGLLEERESSVAKTEETLVTGWRRQEPPALSGDSVPPGRTCGSQSRGTGTAVSAPHDLSGEGGVAAARRDSAGKPQTARERLAARMAAKGAALEGL
ncbi:hypothetical protein VOLCADRAFT_103393 [Volvox carteri f. nagariensis]|uniref:Conserved oligomeric Golgi complex subunit 2 n=1 Tax=Volvox carteri f. nagariensis TaxID=3068 RepID=D8TLK5_VOLCA|nr:uncharacterized protein VOLCADRAFT_103393 [Volvox carteri f. nagariensis]EFJ51890.1 hypothetical protein VOLCADRAFT_103393 [Volvox carteri f. nagariensis]|eukprot:XP_002947300.1 hypothetical protein VOLCADRAFT_103393 [Volvox carteri f. nagariensis]